MELLFVSTSNSDSERQETRPEAARSLGRRRTAGIYGYIMDDFHAQICFGIY